MDHHKLEPDYHWVLINGKPFVMYLHLEPFQEWPAPGNLDWMSFEKYLERINSAGTLQGRS